MKHFMLLGGLHKEGDTVFDKGDIVDSNRDLDKIFRHKFRRVRPEEIGLEPEDIEEVPEPAQDTPPPPALRARHKGRGRWVVENVETGKQINDEYLTKAEAVALVDVG